MNEIRYPLGLRLFYRLLRFMERMKAARWELVERYESR